jgi:hypothetical protein
MESELTSVLPGFTDVNVFVVCGITHTQIRVYGNAVKIRKPGFVADVYINRRTQEVSIARIDTNDTMTLDTILGVVSRFQF